MVARGRLYQNSKTPYATAKHQTGLCAAKHHGPAVVEALNNIREEKEPV